MPKNKCGSCGLVNLATDESCRRCGVPLNVPVEIIEEQPLEAPIEKRSFARRLIWILSTTLFILTIWYASLLLSADDLTPDQRETITRATNVLDQRGFSSNAFVLRHLVAYRSTDNWWNRYIGHRDAYAATNFPFEIVTLYPEFFDVPVDDCERAAVLLHEARHLLGDGEEAALRTTWQNKRRLGWTVDRYRQTRVWDATERLTKAQFPYMFQCGSDGQSDCY